MDLIKAKVVLKSEKRKLMRNVVKTLLCLFLFISINTELFAQEYSNIIGFIDNYTTGKPLPDVNIRIKNTSYGTSSNDDGTFLFQKVKSGKYELEFTRIGYRTYIKKITIETGKILNLKIHLQEVSENLEEVVVTVKSKARKIREQAMPTSVILINEIQGTVSDVNEILAKTTGVQVRNTGGVGSSSRLSVRGLEGKRIGYFIDETPMNDNSDFMDLNDIPIDMIERIEVYKGIVPAKLGGSAIGGAVNIVTKEYPPNYADISYTIASFNTHKASAVLKTTKNGYQLGIGGFYTYSDNNYKMELPKEKGKIVTRNHDQFKKITIGGSFISKKWWFDEVELETLTTLTQKQIQGVENYDFKEAQKKHNAYLLSLHTEKKDFFIPGLDFDLTSNYTYTQFQFVDKATSRYDFNGNKIPPATAYGGETGIYPSNANINKNLFINKLNLNYILNNWSSLNLNSLLNFAKANPTDKLKDKVIGYKTNYDSHLLSLVTGLNYEMRFLNDKLTNSVSVKHYYYNMKTQLREKLGFGNLIDIHNQQSQWGINEAIRYRFTPRFLIKSSIAYDVRLPAEDELIGDGFLVMPSGNLLPERSTNFNIGFMYDKSLRSSGRFQFEINGFYAYLKDMIRFVGGLLQSNYQNFGEMRTFGTEIEIKWDATPFLYLYTNATYQDLRDVREYDAGSSNPNSTQGKRMPNIPYLFANVGFEIHKNNLFGGKEQNSRLFVNGSFVEEYFYDFEQSIYQERRIPKSLIFDMGLEHSFKNQSVIIGFQANNITNQKVISEFNRPLPKRNFAVKLRYIMK